MALLCHALPAPLTAGLGTGIKGHTLRETRGAWQGKWGGSTGFCGNSIQVLHYGKKGNHTMPGCSTLAKDKARGQQGGAGSSHTMGGVTGGDMVVSQDIIKVGRCTGVGKVAAGDPWGYECHCLTVGCWGSGQPSPQTVHYPASVDAQEHLQVRHLCQKQSLILLIAWPWDLCAP